MDTKLNISLTEIELINLGFEKKIVPHAYGLTEIHFENKFCWIYFIKDYYEIELIIGDKRINLFRKFYFVHELTDIIKAIYGVDLK
jgi:hypothetical protein